MPIFTLVTNLPESKINPQVLQSASKLLAHMFDVTEKNVLISIKAGVPMMWGTQTGYYGLGTIQNTENVDVETTKNLAPQIFEFVEEHLEIPQNRMYISFIKISPTNIANNGKTFFEASKSKQNGCLS